MSSLLEAVKMMKEELATKHVILEAKLLELCYTPLLTKDAVQGALRKR